MIERRMIGINNQWPVPTINVKKNDRVQIHLTNQLGDRNTSLHFHGLFQKGQNAMDGPEMVTQCPVPPGATFIYDFTVDDQAGTYWYHSHSGAQYADGLRGLFIVQEDLPFKYDEEVLLSVSDYYHLESPEIMKSFKSRYNPTGAEPIPQNSLFNDTRNATWNVAPDTTYLLRVTNMGLFVAQNLYIEDHKLTIVEIDGVLVDPVEVDSLYLTPAQRYSVLLKTKSSLKKNYRFINVIDEEMLDLLPEELSIISTNWVVYNKGAELPLALPNGKGKYLKLVSKLNPVDDFTLTPRIKVPLLGEADYQINLDFTMEQLGDGVTYAFFNNITYAPPKVPTLMSVLSSGEFATTQSIYGSNTNSFVIQPNEIVEIVLNNRDPGKHPFHLHGHVFQLISRSGEGEDDDPIVYDPTNTNHTNFPEYPMVRDTVQVLPNGFIVLRFKADNPGVWFFHCHVDWHLEQGLAITLIESPLEIQANQDLSANHLDTCKLGEVGVKGNAAGNFGDRQAWLNLKGENVQFPPLAEGFTLKGYIALMLCSFVALFGVLSIYKYGMEDVNSEDAELMIGKLYKILEDNT